MSHSLRRLLLASATITALALTGCSTITDEPAGSDEPAAEGKGAVDKILFDYPFTALPVYAALVQFTQERADELGVQIEYTNDNMDLAQQVTNLTTYLSSDVDAVVSFPADPASLEGIAKQYMDAGKYWVSYGGDLENQDATLQFSFYESGYLLGEHAGQWALENLDGKGKVVIIEDQIIQLGQERTQGILDGLTETAPDMEIVVQQQGITPEEGLTVMNAALAQHPDVNMVLTAAGDAAQGAYQALVASGRAENDAKTYVGGLDGNLFLLQQMEAGNFLRGIVTVSVKDISNAIIDICIALGEGENPGKVDVPVTLVDADSPILSDLIVEFGG